MENRNYWAFKKPAQGLGELYLYKPISSDEWDTDGTSAIGFKKELDALGDIGQLNLYINSPGGSIFEGLAIYNMLTRIPCKKAAYVDGIAASIATLPLLAADVRYMPENALVMIHNGWLTERGDAAALRKAADDIEKATEAMKGIYLERTKLDAETLERMMNAETWLTAAQCKEYGFIQEILPPKKMAASIPPDSMESADDRLREAESIKASIEGANALLENMKGVLSV